MAEVTHANDAKNQLHCCIVGDLTAVLTGSCLSIAFDERDRNDLVYLYAFYMLILAFYYLNVIYIV